MRSSLFLLQLLVLSWRVMICNDMINSIAKEGGRASEDDDESCSGTICDEEGSKGVLSRAASSKSHVH